MRVRYILELSSGGLTLLAGPSSRVSLLQAMIVVHWTYLNPLLVACGVPKPQIKSLHQSLTVTSVTYAPVLNAVR